MKYETLSRVFLTLLDEYCKDLKYNVEVRCILLNIDRSKTDNEGGDWSDWQPFSGQAPEVGVSIRQLSLLPQDHGV